MEPGQNLLSWANAHGVGETTFDRARTTRTFANHPLKSGLTVAPLAPLEAQTHGVLVVKVTANPEDAVATTVTGDCGKVLSASGPKVIVWVIFGAARAEGTPTTAASNAPAPTVKNTRCNIRPRIVPPVLLPVRGGVGSDQGSEDRGASSEALVCQPG